MACQNLHRGAGKKHFYRLRNRENLCGIGLRCCHWRAGRRFVGEERHLYAMIVNGQ